MGSFPSNVADVLGLSPLKKLPVGHHRVSLVVLCALAELCLHQGLDLTSLWELLTSATLLSADHRHLQYSRARLLKPGVSKLRPVFRHGCQVSEIIAVWDNNLLPCGTL